MDGENGQQHVYLFPFLAHGHMIPMVDMARLFAARGVRATIVTTPLNALFISKAIAKKVSSDTEEFVIPNLPNEIKFSRNQIPSFIMQEGETELSKVFRASVESVYRSYGIVFNSFYELEGAYTDYYKNVLGRKCWNIGPVSLTNKDPEEKAHRGEASTVDHGCLKWLETKQPNSVVYVCFGSKQKFTSEQLMEIALGLEASGQQFIWVVKKDKRDEGNGTWLPEGFEKKTEGKGLIVRGWAPQLLILSHEAVGGFVTHCGWNSVLEAVSAGVPMVTWPMVADQFFNQKLVTQVLKIGVEVGIRWVGDSAKKDAIKMAVTWIIAGEEAEVLRNRATALAETARGAVCRGRIIF